MESEQLQNFNERLSQWVANQGFWFQVRYSMSGSGMKGRAMFHLLRMGFRLLIFLALVALGTWIYRLAVNAALSHVSRRSRRSEVGDDELERVAAPEEVRRDPRLSARVEDAMARLPAGYRAILVLHDVEGLSHEECAAIMDCRVGTSKSQLHKARAKMRDLLGPELAAERGRGVPDEEGA